MRLSDALKSCREDECMTRRKWMECGLNIRLLSSVKIIEELDVTLTEESFFANDWLIVNMEEI